MSTTSDVMEASAEYVEAQALGPWDVPAHGRTWTVGELSLDKTLRLLDAMQALAAASSTAEDAISGWVEGEIERLQARQAAATDEDRQGALDAYRAAVRAATPEATDEQVEAHARRMLLVAEPPDQRRRLARMLPFVYREARDELVRVLAIAVAPGPDLEAADVDGRADAYLNDLARQLRHTTSLAGTLQLVARLAARLRDEATDDALGEALASCKEAFSALQAAVSDSPPPAPNGSQPSTRGRG